MGGTDYYGVTIMGFLGFLGLLFIGLKLTSYIAWSWWWVLLPLYGPLLIAVPILVLHAYFMKSDPMYRLRQHVRNFLQ